MIFLLADLKQTKRIIFFFKALVNKVHLIGCGSVSTKKRREWKIENFWYFYVKHLKKQWNGYDAETNSFRLRCQDFQVTAVTGL